MNDLQKKMQERHAGDLNKLKMEKQKLLASHKEQIELNDNNWDEKIKKIKKSHEKEINKIRTSNDNESCEKTSLFQQQSNKIDSLETKLKNLNEENKTQKS